MTVISTEPDLGRIFPHHAINLRIPTMPSRHTELKASTYSELMPSTVLR